MTNLDITFDSEKLKLGTLQVGKGKNSITYRIDLAVFPERHYVISAPDGVTYLADIQNIRNLRNSPEIPTNLRCKFIEHSRYFEGRLQHLDR